MERWIKISSGGTWSDMIPRKTMPRFSAQRSICLQLHIFHHHSRNARVQLLIRRTPQIFKIDPDRKAGCFDVRLVAFQKKRDRDKDAQGKGTSVMLGYDADLNALM